MFNLKNMSKVKNLKVMMILMVCLMTIVSVGCTKEKDEYNRNLTRSEWKIKSADIVGKQTHIVDYLGVEAYETQIRIDSTHIAGTNRTSVDYRLYKKTRISDSFIKNPILSSEKLRITKTTINSYFTGKWIFKEGGMGSYGITDHAISTFTEQTGMPDTINANAGPLNNSNSFYWKWKNNDKQKANLEFPLYELLPIPVDKDTPVNFTVVELDKEQLVLECVSETSSSYQPDADTKVTKTITLSIFITFEH